MDAPRPQSSETEQRVQEQKDQQCTEAANQNDGARSQTQTTCCSHVPPRSRPEQAATKQPAASNKVEPSGLQSEDDVIDMRGFREYLDEQDFLARYVSYVTDIEDVVYYVFSDDSTIRKALAERVVYFKETGDVMRLLSPLSFSQFESAMLASDDDLPPLELVAKVWVTALQSFGLTLDQYRLLQDFKGAPYIGGYDPVKALEELKSGAAPVPKRFEEHRPALVALLELLARSP